MHYAPLSPPESRWDGLGDFLRDATEPELRAEYEAADDVGDYDLLHTIACAIRERFTDS